MNIFKIQEQIDETNYWDAFALDFRATFFGDECKLYIEVDDAEQDLFCWEISFVRCYKVKYETDSGWTGWTLDGGVRNFDMKFVPLKQLISHTVQDITLENQSKDMVKCNIVLSSMVISIICQDIKVNTVLIKEQNFFWDC